MNTHYKQYYPFVSPYDPCPPIQVRIYSTPPNLYLGYQQPSLPQFSPAEALRAGTLWKSFYDPYFSPLEQGRDGNPT